MESAKATATAWKFGTSARWGGKQLGPDGANAQLVDPKPTSGWLGDAAAFSFGTSNRYVVGEGVPGCKPTFRLTPGPGSYQLQSCLGTQVCQSPKLRSLRKFSGTAFQYLVPSSTLQTPLMCFLGLGGRANVSWCCALCLQAGN